MTPSVQGTYLTKLEASDSVLRASRNSVLTVNPPNTSFGVASFTLIDATTDSPFPGYDTIPNGAVINLSSLGSAPQINIRANIVTSGVASMRWLSDAASLSVDNSQPFAIAPSTTADYPSWSYAKQLYRITAVPYAAANASGTQGAALSIDFVLR